MAGRGSGRRWLTVVLVAVVATGLSGYVWADACGMAPGLLTTEPPPEPYPSVPAASGMAPPQARPEPADPLPADAAMPTPAVLATQVQPLLADPALGPSVSATVIDTSTGAVLLDSSAATPKEPASVAKVLTGAAALAQLGPDATIATTVVATPGSNQLTLVGAGDVLLGSGAGQPDAVQGRAGLADLAAQTAATLKQQGQTSVGVSLDDSALGGIGWGESMGPGWANADITNGFVAPITGIAVNAGRLRDENYAPRVNDPGLDAAQQFAAALKQAGVNVDGPIRRGAAPADAPVLATVHSAPISEVVGFMLDHSDNNVAESLARLVAVKRGAAPTFAGSGQAVLQSVQALGVDLTGCELVGGSGLADGSRLTAAALAQTLAVASADTGAQLRPLLRGLPIAGLTGTLTDRFGPASGAAAGVGKVHAKTGSLTGVSALAGQVTTADGRLVTFAVLADQVPATDPARAAIDRFTVAVAACGCR